ncbi:protein CHLOROPLAST IMPORT APPARATUS 2-like [Andrographis paniculata]|uniref:protein CHLOROPLAST IMPORT APPARATUS 2-like n=1 Tax=Andrographis paniculata TaxID=175694 RepID=UPI0021E756DA|nr:protein CHLOROPLAST IMPORT APPARATUS 2-like [Andrographis paniculata]
MSSCLSGSGRAFGLDLEIIKSPTASWTSTNSSSLSESRNSPISISTRKARTPRKRPNQVYDEAAAILSTAYPKLFPTKHLSKPCKFPNLPTPYLLEPLDLLMPFLDGSGCSRERSNVPAKRKGLSHLEKTCQSPGNREISSDVYNLLEACDDYREDFNAESILDDEIGEGIDSIMGKLSMEISPTHPSICASSSHTNSLYSYPVGVGLGIDFGCGIRREMRAIRNVDEGDWWRYPTVVNVADTTKRITRKAAENNNSVTVKEPTTHSKAGLLLKLNHNNVLSQWAGKGSPFVDGFPGSDVHARLAQIDLFPEQESGGRGRGRGRGVTVNKERGCKRASSKKISCQVRKAKPDQRSSARGRCVRKPNCANDG